MRPYCAASLDRSRCCWMARSRGWSSGANRGTKEQKSRKSRPWCASERNWGPGKEGAWRWERRARAFPHGQTLSQRVPYEQARSWSVFGCSKSDVINLTSGIPARPARLWGARIPRSTRAPRQMPTGSRCGRRDFLGKWSRWAMAPRRPGHSPSSGPFDWWEPRAPVGGNGRGTRPALPPVPCANAGQPLPTAGWRTH